MSETQSKVESVGQPPSMLQKRAVIPGNAGIDYEAIERAETALSALSENFESWMTDELEALMSANRNIIKSGKNKDTIEALFHTAHDIKGQAATLGYPLAGSVAASLCKLTLDSPAPERIPQILLDQHVNSIQAIVTEKVRDTKNKTARTLIQRLTLVTNDFIDQLNGKSSEPEQASD